MLPIFRTEIFAADVEHQIHWYLTETDLDEVMAVELAHRFAAAVEETLEFLSRAVSMFSSRSDASAFIIG